jgi:hypothetical protein
MVVTDPYRPKSALRLVAAIAVLGAGGVATIGIGASLLIVGHVCGDSGGCSRVSNVDELLAVVLCMATYLGCTALATRILLGRGALRAAGPARAAGLVASLAPLFPAALLATLWVNERHHGHVIAVTTFVCTAVPYGVMWLVLARRLVRSNATGP